MIRRLALAAVLTSALSAGWGRTLLVNSYNAYNGGSNFMYGQALWTGTTAALNAAFGASNITVNANPLASADLANVDALLVGIRTYTATLSATEISALQAFIASGRRVVIIGENGGSFSTWDTSFLTVLGGSLGSDSSSSLVPAVTNSLTAGVTGIDTGTGGVAVGGESLFNPNMITLWGANRNVLTILDGNALDDSTGAAAGNMQFKTNMANWLAAVPSPPQPATVPALSEWGLALLAIALAGAAGALLTRRLNPELN
jgi:hypothetical protein